VFVADKLPREPKEKEMKKLLFIGLLMALILAACGGGDGSEAPGEVVKKVVDAMTTMDFDGASEFICADQKTEFQGSMTEGFAELEAMGLDPDELLDAFKIGLKDMKYETQSEDGDKAVVKVTGSLSLDFDTEKLKSFFKQAAEAAGQPVSDEELDMVVNIFNAMGGQEAPLDSNVDVVKEDGEWVVCGDLGFLDSSELLNLPLP
jgi:hypothetical protein